MAKLNGLQHWLVSSGLELQRQAMKAEVKAIEERGKNALMTQGYVDTIIDEAQREVDSNTLKSALKELKKYI